MFELHIETSKVEGSTISERAAELAAILLLLAAALIADPEQEGRRTVRDTEGNPVGELIYTEF